MRTSITGRIERLAALLLSPYLLWVACATTINIGVVVLSLAARRRTDSPQRLLGPLGVSPGRRLARMAGDPKCLAFE